MRTKTWVYVCRSEWTNVCFLPCQAVSLGLMFSMAFFSESVNSLVSGRFVSGLPWKNSAGIRSVLPWTNSAGEALMSSLYAVRNPNRMIRRWSVQCVVSLQQMAAFKVRCQHSIRPLACGWYAVVRKCVIPSSLVSSANSADRNCLPRSIVTNVGTPKRDIQPVSNADATLGAVMSDKGMGSGQRVKRSIMVRQQRYQLLTANGPTMSRLM